MGAKKSKPAAAKPPDSDALICKVVINGDPGVGKTSLLLYELKQEHDDKGVISLGSDSMSETYKIDGTTIRAVYWDTAGQEKFRAITSSYFQGSNVVINVFDLTSRDSFSNVKEWIAESRKMTHESCAILLIGNKLDQTSNRMISPEECQQLANGKNVLYFEASAKTGEGVREAFQAALKEFLRVRQAAF